MQPTIAAMSAALAAGETTSEVLVDDALDRIGDERGQGRLAFTKRFDTAARIAARETDALRAAGLTATALTGLPVSVKDLFDVRGEVTTGGSVALGNRPPARDDAAIVRRLRAAGAVIVGRTNMTELAYSGLGLNPHFGTPLNPYDRDSARIPGGSSSGAAVAVAERMCVAGVGTDTGGSVRIPAALCGLVGFKPTQHRVPADGTLPLSPTLDTIGPIANTVRCCAAVDAALAGIRDDFVDVAVRGLRVGVLRDLVFDGASDYVAARIEATLAKLADAGVHVRDVPHAGFLRELPDINARGGFAAAESYALWGETIERDERSFDPRVVQRVFNGRDHSAADYLRLLEHRRRLTQALDDATWPFDMVACPTVPTIAPRFAELDADDAYFSTNALMLRNPSLCNFFDRPAVSVPCHDPGEAPVGFMLIGARDGDRRLLAIAGAVERVIAPAGWQRQ